mgnify:CR=1 FL=1
MIKSSLQSRPDDYSHIQDVENLEISTDLEFRNEQSFKINAKTGEVLPYF